MTLKEQLTADLTTFLNVDEFGELVDIDGEPVTCVFDGNGDTEGNQDGITDVDTIAYAKASDFSTRPVVGQRLTIDEEQAQVIAVDEQGEILVIRLRWYDS